MWPPTRPSATRRWPSGVSGSDELGSAVVDGGAATGTAKTVGPGGSVSDGGSRGLTGYSIVSADSLDSAVELAKGCPVLEIGGAVDVYEAIAM